jgi:uncharacterized protein YqjF (DUF2071 family)
MTSPTLDQRLAARDHGVASPVMYQRWSKLLFLHWRWDAEDLQRRLPKGLYVDKHEGEAWLGIVPFYMERIRPRFLPCVPWLSWFLELNVRTYVHDENGTPGVWFFSLDCNQPVAVQIARRGFSIPYNDARMSARRDAHRIQYQCRRSGKDGVSSFDYTLSPAARHAVPGTLDFFLAERYVLFANTQRGLHIGYVHHTPYPLCEAAVAGFDQLPFAWDEFEAADRPPDHIIGSAGVDVRIGALQIA